MAWKCKVCNKSWSDLFIKCPNCACIRQEAIASVALDNLDDGGTRVEDPTETKAHRVAEALGWEFKRINADLNYTLFKIDGGDCVLMNREVAKISAILDERDALQKQLAKLTDDLPHQGPSRSRIPRWLGEEALDVYHRKYFRGDKREVAWKNIFERGGFGDGELDTFAPGWREKLDIVTQLRAELEGANISIKNSNTTNEYLRDDYAVLLEAHKGIKDELATAKAETLKWQRIRKPTHGSCCTCQKCGLDYDSCRCDLDETVDELESAKAEIERLRPNAEKWRAWDAACQTVDDVFLPKEAQL